jgi:hypothetical protein
MMEVFIASHRDFLADARRVTRGWLERVSMLMVRIAMTCRLFGLFLAVSSLACGVAPPSSRAHSIGDSPPHPPPRFARDAPPPVLSPKTPDSPPAPDPPPPADPGPPFPPPSFEAPFARTKKPSDGKFSPLELGAAEGTGALALAEVHPHPVKPHPRVVVVAIDLRRVGLRLAAGTEEPVSTTVPAERRPGLVPAAELPALLAVFNGGFMAQHGKWGMKADGDVFLPPRPDACTVAILDDGAVRIASFPALEPFAPRIRSYRQTPPCLVEGAALHPRLPAEDTARLWGAAVGGDREIRRTALGIDASGRTLFFGMGEWVWARDLAVAMKSAGAVDAAELDINWSYTRFLLYDRARPPEVVSTLVDKVEYTKGGYVSKPAPRDFFYLVQKTPPGAGAGVTHP